MGEPRAIKEGGLTGGEPASYGGYAQIGLLLTPTRPEEFEGVAQTYGAAAEQLGQAFTELKSHASRLVADGDWGGESARAMLGRMARVQAYLETLKGAIDRIPPAVRSAGHDLQRAKDAFAGLEQRYGTARVPENDVDEAAREVMGALNGKLAQAYGSLPDRLPWDADLASGAPCLPPPVRVEAGTGDSLSGLETAGAPAPTTSLSGAPGTPGVPGVPAGPTAPAGPVAPGVPGTAPLAGAPASPQQLSAMAAPLPNTSTAALPATVVPHLSGTPATRTASPLVGAPVRTPEPPIGARATPQRRTGDPATPSSPIHDQAAPPGSPRETGPTVRRAWCRSSTDPGPPPERRSPPPASPATGACRSCPWAPLRSARTCRPAATPPRPPLTTPPSGVPATTPDLRW
ncbi:WXG100 family type VII secretion target [Nonomuraea sp. NPDC000554]|uniref:WXG100 family type VII secretion target n=1 Tax=Nonomuraea sp. NPDC000554 TaxID=3154259 RepID=UPI00332D2481